MLESNNKKQQRNLIFILGGCLFILMCLFCGGVVLLSGYFIWDTRQDKLAEVEATAVSTPLPQPPPTSILTATPFLPSAEPTQPIEIPSATIVAPTDVPPSPTPTPILLNVPPEIVQFPIEPADYEIIQRLFEIPQPAYDYFETVENLGKEDLGARTIKRTPFQKGDVHSFDADEKVIDATLVAVTDHAYFWVENGLNLDETAVQTAADRLEDQYLQSLFFLFGNYWSPGIDGDPRFSVLHFAGEPEAYELGFFTDQDEYPRTLLPQSNEQEMIYLNMTALDLGEELYYGTLVHEIGHLIHWFVDKNESTWLNEGLSQLIEIYVGLETANTDAYLEQPSVRLDGWEQDEDVVDAHYAAGYLFSVYFWEQLGETAVQELFRSPQNSLASVRQVLMGYRPDLSLEQFIANWAAANFLDDPAAGTEYGYVNLELERPLIENRARQLPFDSISSLNQYGVHYIDLDLSGPVTISFAGDSHVSLVDTVAPSGSDVWFVPPSDDTDARLNGRFDLSNVSTATLEFDTWYDLEFDYDFAYLSISTDGGESWELLFPEHAVPGDYGPGFNGYSSEENDAADGWVHESISLNAYVGQTIDLRFELLTDFDDSGLGFALDNIKIPEINFEDDVETANPAWQSEGFIRTPTIIPQQWAVQLIQPGSPPSVQVLPLNYLNQLQQQVDLGTGGGTLVLVPLTPYGETAVNYWLHIE